MWLFNNRIWLIIMLKNHLIENTSMICHTYDESVMHFGLKGELHSNYIFLHFAWVFFALVFFLLKLTFYYHLNKIYMAFYSLTWTYLNDVNGGKNLSLKESFLWAATIKNEAKLIKTEKTWKKKITAMKATLVKMRYQIF